MGPSRSVLVSDGGYAQSKPSLAAVRALSIAGYSPTVTVSDSLSLASASRHRAKTIAVPSVDLDPSGYKEAIEAELRNDTYVTVLPCSDPVVRALDFASADLLDKGILSRAVTTAGMRSPPCEVFDTPEDLVDASHRLDFPLVVKPTRYHGSYRANAPADLRWWRGRDGPLLVQPYVAERQWAVSGVVWRGQLIAAAHQRYLRTWPVEPGGHAAAVETIEPEPKIEQQLLVLLRRHEGLFQAQFRGPYLLDLNPRVSTSLPAAVAAGANLPAIYCDLVLGKTIEPVRARPGVFYRWLDGDIRSVLWSVRRGRMTKRQALEALWPRRGTVHGPESLKDPGPMLARTRQGISTRVRKAARRRG